MDKPIVTVLILCYNHEEYVRQAIESVRDQTYSFVQLIVVDDKSTDNSRIAIEQIMQEHPFEFIASEKNEGLNQSIIKGLNKTKGKYVSVLASDDMILPTKLEEQVSFLEVEGLDGLYATGYYYKKDTPTRIPLTKTFLHYDQPAALKYIYQHDWGAPLLQSGLFKTSVMLELLEVRQQFKSDDWAFTIKAFEKYKIGIMNRALFYYRLHDTNTHKNYWNTFPMRIDIVSRLVPEQFRIKALSNILLSQGQYLMADRKTGAAISFYISSLLMNFSISKLVLIGKSIVSPLKRKFRSPN